MIIHSIEMDEFIPSEWKLKPYDLKMINDLARNHPYQETMFLVYKYYCSYVDEFPGDILNEVDYFEILDNYCRDGITFQKKQDLYRENVLCVKEDFDETLPFRYLIDNSYNLKQLLFNDVIRIRINDLDNGEITLSEIEKWKRKVVNQQTDRKTRLRLLDPNIYHSLITFVVFSNFKERSHNKIDYDLSGDGISGVDRKLNNYKNKYNYTKIYEDKIYNKIKMLLL